MLDINLIYSNCVDYNGPESEYTEVAKETKTLFERLCKKHFRGEEVEEGEEGGEKGKKRKRRSSRSPSTCKTPELTSESSSEEDSDGRFE